MRLLHRSNLREHGRSAININLVIAGTIVATVGLCGSSAVAEALPQSWHAQYRAYLAAPRPVSGGSDFTCPPRSAVGEVESLIQDHHCDRERAARSQGKPLAGVQAKAQTALTFQFGVCRPVTQSAVVGLSCLKISRPTGQKHFLLQF